MVKAGWQVQSGETLLIGAHSGPTCPHASPSPTISMSEEMDIWRQAQDAERKSWDRLRMSSHQVLKIPPLRDLPMPWRLGELEEKKFWRGQNVAMGGDLGTKTSSPQGPAGRGRDGGSLGCQHWSQPRRVCLCRLLGLGPWR